MQKSKVISSHDLEDEYLTQIVSVSKLLRISTKDVLKYRSALTKQLVVANSRFDKTNKWDMFAKAYGHKSKVK